MKAGNYEVFVTPGNEQQNGQVYMQHGSEYALNLVNHHHSQCDAYVEIDGKHVGAWRMRAMQTIWLERPVDVQKKFTFVRLQSAEGEAAELDHVSPEKLGLISVIFTPELHRQPVYRPDSSSRSLPEPGARSEETRGMAAGGTALGAHSTQQFVHVGPLELDHARAVTIHLRLVEGPSVSPLREVKPELVATPIPPQV